MICIIDIRIIRCCSLACTHSFMGRLNRVTVTVHIFHILNIRFQCYTLLPYKADTIVTWTVGTKCITCTR